MLIKKINCPFIIQKHLPVCFIFLHLSFKKILLKDSLPQGNRMPHYQKNISAQISLLFSKRLFLISKIYFFNLYYTYYFILFR
jgi:hypothetical protein